MLCTGLRYGNGERIFYNHFFKAWIQNPPALQIVSKGENLVPSIHIIDLARLVRRIIEKNKVHPYIFAIDKTTRPSQKRLVQAISKGMGTGKIALDAPEVPGTTDDFLTINLKMKVSEAFKDGELTPEEEENADDAEALLKEKKFPWHCEKGVIGNIATLNKEFNEFRGLKPVKIFVTGPPASGKSFYSASIAKYYNIPHVHIKELTDAALAISLLDEEQIGEDEEKANIKAKCDELRDKMVADMEEARGDPKEGEEWPEIDRTTLPIRVPDEILWKLLNTKLLENDCRNRGYILDGFPRTHKGAMNIFLKWKQVMNEDGEPEDEPEQDLEEGQEKDFSGYIPDADIMPANCIILEGNDKDLTRRVRDLPESKILGTHYTSKDMERRMKAYRLANNSIIAEPSVQDFFKT